jgi:hypothetical protein
MKKLLLSLVLLPSLVWVTTKTGKIWFKLENSADDLEISW